MGSWAVQPSSEELMKRRLATMAAAEIPPRMARVPSTLPNLPRRLAFLTDFVSMPALVASSVDSPLRAETAACPRRVASSTAGRAVTFSARSSSPGRTSFWKVS